MGNCLADEEVVVEKVLLANLAPETGASGYGDEALKKRFVTLHFPMGLGIVAAVLKKAGIPFEVYDSYVNGTSDGFLSKVASNKPDAILLSGFLGNFTLRFIQEISRKIRECSPATKIVIGGPIGTTVPELLITRTDIDYVVIGEGEVTSVELVSVINGGGDGTAVRGIAFRDIRSQPVFTADRERIKNLDEHPFPLYSAFKMEPYASYLKETGRCWEISASRGCYAKCNFCKLTFGQKITYYSCKAVVDHMCYINETYGINRFNFVDDNFLNNAKRIEEFSKLLQSARYQFKWRFQGRADKITPKDVEVLSKVGLYDISVGIESGSQEMLDRLGKNLNINAALENLVAIREIVDVHATFIVGGPGESWETVRATERFIRELKLNNAGIGILTLFPNTKFYDKAVKDGIIKNEYEYCMQLGPVYDWPYVNISSLSDDELISARDQLVNVAAEFGSYV